MTIKFDLLARERVRPLPMPEYVGEARDLYIEKTTVADARGWIAEYHYSHIMPDSTKEVFAGYYPGGVLAGFIVFGMGSGKGQFLRLLPDLQNGEYRELTRLWSPDIMPRNTESRLIGAAIKKLKGVRLLLSYADGSQNHVGTIYQATNWIYTGLTHGGTRLVNPSGQEQHSRLVSMYKKRHPDLYGKMTLKQIIKTLGWRVIDNPPKHRYIKIINKRDKQTVLSRTAVLPYPKIGETD